MGDPVQRLVGHCFNYGVLEGIKYPSSLYLIASIERNGFIFFSSRFLDRPAESFPLSKIAVDAIVIARIESRIVHKNNKKCLFKA